MLIYIQYICRRRFLDGNSEETVNVLYGQYRNDCWIPLSFNFDDDS